MRDLADTAVSWRATVSEPYGGAPFLAPNWEKAFFEARNSLRVMIQIRSLLPILIFFIPLAPAIPFGPTFAITASQIYFNTGHIIAWGAKECYFVSHVTRCYSFLFYYLHVCIYCRELYTAKRQVTKREIDQMYSSPLRSMSEHHALFSYRPDRVMHTSTYLRRSWAISSIYLHYFLVFRFKRYH